MCCVLSCFSNVWLFATPWTIAHHASLSMGFSRQEYWSGVVISSSRGSSQPRIRTHLSRVSGIGRWVFTTEPPRESPGGVHCAIYFWLAPSSGQRETSGHFGHQGSLESWVRFEGTSNKWQMSQMCQVWEKLLFHIVVDFLFSPIIFGYDFIDCACITGKLVIKF